MNKLFGLTLILLFAVVCIEGFQWPMPYQ